MSQISNYKQRLNDLTEAFRKGLEHWYQCGEIVASMIDEDPEVIERICKDVPALTTGILRRLEQIGRKQLVPELLLKTGPGWSRLLQMPYDVQKKYLTAPVEVLIGTDTGPDILKVSIDNLDSKQARQVFAPDGTIRDHGAQRAYIASQRVVIDIPKEARKPYMVHGRNLVVTEPCRLSLQEIGVILAEMKT